jgi:hypothetical protein
MRLRRQAGDGECALSGRRIFAFLEGGDERVLDPAIAAAREGGGRLVLVATAPMPIGVACGNPYGPALAPHWQSDEEFSREVICRALSRVPADIPVTTVCAGQCIQRSLARMLCHVHPDLVFVSRRRTAGRCRRLTGARVCRIDAGGRARFASARAVRWSRLWTANRRPRSLTTS